MQQIKEELELAKAKRQKSDQKDIKKKRKRRNSILSMTHSLKARYDSVITNNQKTARELKEDMIKVEVQRISIKDSEARHLERMEGKILKRLKEAHAMQKDTI